MCTHVSSRKDLQVSGVKTTGSRKEDNDETQFVFYGDG